VRQWVLSLPKRLRPFRVTGRAPTSIADEVRTVIREIDPTIPVEFTTMDAVLAESVSGERLAMLMLLAFGLTAATASWAAQPKAFNTREAAASERLSYDVPNRFTCTNR
jgi:hypothetical protein